MIGKIDHIGIAVRSIEESRRLYEALGLHVEHIEDVVFDDVRVAMIPCGETRIELIEPLSAASPVAKFLEKRGPGVHHICMATDDIRGAGDRLREEGFQVIRPEPTLGAGGCWVQFIHPKSTGGVMLELNEPIDPASPEGHG